MEEIFEDDLFLPNQPDSPVPWPKLRRLKKGSQSGPPIDSPTADTDPSPPPEEEASASLTITEMPPLEESLTGPGYQMPKSTEAEMDKDGEELDPLFPDLARWQPEYAEIEREEEDCDWGKECGDAGAEKIDGEIAKAKSAKKRLNMEGEGEPTMKKKKSKSGEKTKESAREKNRLEKERKAQLDRLHADSQRLLRETRDASFKAVPLVQKPISSVLEKIKLRKLEMLKSCNILNCPDSTKDTRDNKTDTHDADPSVPENEKGDQLSNENSIHTEESLDAEVESIPSQCGNDLHNHVSNPNSEDTDRTPTVLKEDVSHDSCQTGENIHTVSSSNDASQDALPVLPNSSLKLASADVSGGSSFSSQEDDDENEELHPHKIAKVDLYSEFGPVKAFLDDEAEEEDDSDHDMMRFRETEEDNESDDHEELNDLIATGFEEAPTDYEKRNQLHQKWLEQQDATATDNVLQRLRCNKKQNEPTFSDEEEENEGENENEEENSEGLGDEETYDQNPTNVARQNRKMAKQMIAKMYTDDHDTYLPSDDEETEQTLIRFHLQNHNPESTISRVADDEHSREFFGLIKKTNVVPESKKRAKHNSNFDMMIMRGNSRSSTKASFVGRATNSSIQSSSKQGATAVRAYIFGRDDSNSRSSISVAESSQDMDHMHNQQKKPSAKFSGSQAKSTASKTTDAHRNSGSSLFQILRQSSICFDKQMDGKMKSSKTTMEREAAHQFSAFKLGKFSKA